MDTSIATPTQKRASRITRPHIPHRVLLIDRDREIIKTINDFRLMSEGQIQRLFFPSKNTAQNRLKKLWHAELIKREFLPIVGGMKPTGVGVPLLYSIDTEGAELLQQWFNYKPEDLRLSRSQLSFQFADHTIGLGNTRIEFLKACKRQELTLDTWRDEKALKTSYDHVAVKSNRLVAVLPDGYMKIKLANGNFLHFFIEFDRSTEGLKFFAQKLTAYWLYFQSKQCIDRYGTNIIRVLTVVTGQNAQTSQRRIANMVKGLEKLTGLSLFWFAHLMDLQTHDALTGEFWTRPDRNKPQALISTSQSG